MYDLIMDSAFAQSIGENLFPCPPRGPCAASTAYFPAHGFVHINYQGEFLLLDSVTLSFSFSGYYWLRIAV